MPFPVQSILDDFNRSNEGPPLSGEWTTGVIGGSDGLKVVSNLAEANAGNADGYWNAGVTSSADCEAYFTVVTYVGDNEFQGVHVRLVNIGAGTTDGYRFSVRRRFDIDDFHHLLYRIDNGSYTLIDSNDTSAAGSGDAVGLDVAGSTFTYYRKPSGGSWGSVGSGSDATYSAAGKIGHYITATGGNLATDDYGGGPFAAAGIVIPIVMHSYRRRRMHA